MAQHANLTLSDAAVDLGLALKARGMMLAMAESCTGGLVAEAITGVAGSSAWFDRGFVSYSNAAKTDMLGVPAQTIAQFGAVSEQTAAAMASGALQNSTAHIAGSITGIAGPDGGSAEKPIGTVCFAWAGINLPVTTSTQYFHGDRSAIRQQAAIFMMAGLIERLNTVA